MTGGGVKCWGRNHFGQLGIGSTVDQPRPVDVDLGPGARACVCVGGMRAALLSSWMEFARREPERQCVRVGVYGSVYGRPFEGCLNVRVYGRQVE